MNVTPEHEDGAVPIGNEEYLDAYMNDPSVQPRVSAVSLAESVLTKDGVWVKDIEPGMRLMVATAHNHYFIERKEDGSLQIWGNEKYCPKPVQCTIVGSTWGGSMIKLGFIGRGMCLEFNISDHPKEITTSPIREIMKL
jgi:hypothetical protein